VARQPAASKSAKRKPSARHVDLGTVAALTWLSVAVGLTVLIGPHLGLRGWAWLGLHHLLCVVGSSHELWRARKRQRARLAALPDQPDRPDQGQARTTVTTS